MLTVKYEDSRAAADIYKTLGLEEKPSGANFFMYDGDKPVALWNMSVEVEDEPVGVIRRIYFADGVDEEDRTFFMHAMFFKLMEGAPVKLRVPEADESFAKFGFAEKNGCMEAYSKDINLHYRCGGKKG